MLNISIQDVVAAIVRQELGRTDRDENKALYFNFDCSLSHYTEETQYSQRMGLHLLYHCTPGYRYITVFSATTESGLAKLNEVKEWKHECTHDSCWQNINIFSQICFDMARDINEALVADGLKEMAPIDMHEYNSFNMFSGAECYQWVPVRITKDPNDQHNYRKILELL